MNTGTQLASLYRTPYFGPDITPAHLAAIYREASRELTERGYASRGTSSYATIVHEDNMAGGPVPVSLAGALELGVNYVGRKIAEAAGEFESLYELADERLAGVMLVTGQLTWASPNMTGVQLWDDRNGVAASSPGACTATVILDAAAALMDAIPGTRMEFTADGVTFTNPDGTGHSIPAEYAYPADDADA